MTEPHALKGHTSRALAAAAKLRCTACGETGLFRAGSSCPSCRGTRFELVPWRPFSRAAH
ncbi:MAG TPA: hypothetical protein VK896_00490 [Gaiellaceae bacterium]|nr:hypothetical protein [Gaiellaceae bacterium]